MITLKKLAVAAAICAAGLGAQATFAQSTDGYHTIQVFPVVVDSSTFTQRFTFRNPNSAIVTVSPTYFPGNGTSQATAFTCPSFQIPANGQIVFASVRAMCGALINDGTSQFGYLYTYETNPTNLPYAGFSRVSNFAGNGFSVEAFPAHTFTSAVARVTGIRRLAAGVGTPAFQTNCFVGNLNDITPNVAPEGNGIGYTVRNSAGTTIGSGNISIVPGKLVRMLDVFAASGAPAGDYNDASIEFVESAGRDESALMAFCTVQDNTSFGADFRIAKQEANSPSGATLADWGAVGGQDDHLLRNSTISSDVTTTYTANRPFTLLTGGSRHNTHVMYFRHPDWVQCEVINPTTGVRALPAYGLEMRMLDQDALVIAGGDSSTGWGELYLGDKTDRNFGANTRYTIEVENNSLNNGANIPYRLHCQSGSGHTAGDIIEYGVASESF